MRLAFFLHPGAESAFALCHTRAAEMTVPQLCCIAAGKRVTFSTEDVEKRQNRAEFWRLVLPILQRGRDVVLEYPSWQEAEDADDFSPEELVAKLELCPCLLPLHLLGSYRCLDTLSELIILFAVQGARSPSPLPQTEILKKLPLRDWMLFVCPREKKITGKLHSMTDLLNVRPSLKQRLAELVAANWSLPGDKRCIHLEEGRKWMEEIARSLHMVHLDLFHDSKGPVRKESPLSWGQDVFPAVLGSKVPFCATEDRPPILSGSMLESSLSQANREQLFPWDDGSLREKVRHVILRGATGTGKSTLGRLLLMHEILRDDTARVVYMGPTRMLVEESYAAFCSLAEEFSQQEDFDVISPEHIVISTGERMEQDDRIREGNFRALFIVYEKLNNFFHDTALLRQLSCVMIDEVQMVCDYARGGILDTLLTSLCREADRRFFVEDGAEFLRLIVCTTENFDLRERLALHPGSREKERAPLILEDKQHFRKPSTWFQFRVNKKQYSLPTDFNNRHEKENLVDLAYLKNFPKIGEHSHLSWLKEWMWGHEKVLCVSSRPKEMLGWAKTLSTGRPEMITDEVLLTRLHDELLQEEFNEQTCAQIVMCARKGIFFNFSTMGYAARGTSAYMFRECRYQRGTPVVAFATSTIMYGVNLPADLLLLTDLEWPRTSIEEARGGYANPWAKHFAYLQPCEIRNMTGRVGRQGLSSPHIVPTVVYSSFVPSTPQKVHRFKNVIKHLDKTDVEFSFILNLRKVPQQLADFSPVQQRFLMNCLLHCCDRDKKCSLEQVQAFIETTWAWERVREAGEAEDWRRYIASFFPLLQQEFPESLQLLEKREKIWLIPRLLCYSVCQTGAELATLREVRELVIRWDLQTYPPEAHAVIVLLSLLMTKEIWTLFLDFHQEAKWGRKELEGEEVKFSLTDYQKSCLEETERQENVMVDEFRAELRAFMEERDIDALLLHMRQYLAQRTLPMTLSKNIMGMEKRKVLMAVRSALALLAWSRGARGEDIFRYRRAHLQSAPTSDSFLLYEHTSFRDRFIMRLTYTLNALRVYCVESKVNEALTAAVDAASLLLQSNTSNLTMDIPSINEGKQ